MAIFADTFQASQGRKRQKIRLNGCSQFTEFMPVLHPYTPCQSAAVHPIKNNPWPVAEQLFVDALAR